MDSRHPILRRLLHFSMHFRALATEMGLRFRHFPLEDSASRFGIQAAAETNMLKVLHIAAGCVQVHRGPQGAT